MKPWIKLSCVFTVFAALLLSGCAVTPPAVQNSHKSSGYDKNLSDIYLVVDKAFIEKAHDQYFWRNDAEKQKIIDHFSLSKILTLEKLKSEFVNQFNVEGVVANVIEPEYDLNPVDKSNPQKRIPKITLSQKKPVLIISLKTYKTYYGQFNGDVSWSVTLFDTEKADASGSAIAWSMTTNIFDFGPGVSRNADLNDQVKAKMSDQYGAKAKNLAVLVVNQMKKDGLIAEKKN